MSSHYLFPPIPKIDLTNDVTLIIVTSPIQIHPSTKLIDNAIKGLQGHNFSCKIISYDKPKQNNVNYDKYKEIMKNKYPDFIHLELEQHGHFIGAFYNALAICKTKYVFMNQHDIKLIGTFPIETIKNTLDNDCNIIFTHHKKKGLKPSHWFPIIENTKNQDILKTWGWCERIFITKTDFMINKIYQCYHKKPQPITVNFMDTIFFRQFKRLYRKTQNINTYKDINYENNKLVYDSYWEQWKPYCLKKSICYHKHLCGRTITKDNLK